MISRLPIGWEWPNSEDVVVTYEYFRDVLATWPWTNATLPKEHDIVHLGRYVAEVVAVDTWKETYTLRRKDWWIDNAPH